MQRRSQRAASSHHRWVKAAPYRPVCREGGCSALYAEGPVAHTAPGREGHSLADHVQLVALPGAQLRALAEVLSAAGQAALAWTACTKAGGGACCFASKP